MSKHSLALANAHDLNIGNSILDMCMRSQKYYYSIYHMKWSDPLITSELFINIIQFVACLPLPKYGFPYMIWLLCYIYYLPIVWLCVSIPISYWYLFHIITINSQQCLTPSVPAQTPPMHDRLAARLGSTLNIRPIDWLSITLNEL